MGTPTTKPLTNSQLGILSGALAQALKKVGENAEVAKTLPPVTEKVNVRKCTVTMDETASEGDATVMCVLDNNNDPADGFLQMVFTGHYKDNRFVSAADTIAFNPKNNPSPTSPVRSVMAWLLRGRQDKSPEAIKADDLVVANALGIRFPATVVSVVDNKVTLLNVVFSYNAGTRFVEGQKDTLFSVTAPTGSDLEFKYINGSTVEVIKVKAGETYTRTTEGMAVGTYSYVLADKDQRVMTSPRSVTITTPVATLSGFSVTRNRDGSVDVNVTTDRRTNCTLYIKDTAVSKSFRLDGAGDFTIKFEKDELKTLGRGIYKVMARAVGGEDEVAGTFTVAGGPPPPPKGKKFGAGRK